MGDTKRGRERKGMVKEEQLRRKEVKRTLEADDEMPEIEDEEIEIDADLEE
ncbi:MAG: hypothetical protein ACQEQY_06525 [Halobacteriota archaeon]|uniref:hypothetical protein n=1 Tax=Halanaeroarchaeum sp. HSR-CO TaxID=2866382 RepID=UPI00217E1418|nr:hypothetical protein [Halanaeroarchaeum sp. HSR-CO]UWG47328.1 Uncharacterized protein HSRCO_1040 [Halanaeroarchaeum sp. HSR-CO]